MAKRRRLALVSIQGANEYRLAVETDGRRITVRQIAGELHGPRNVIGIALHGRPLDGQTFVVVTACRPNRAKRAKPARRGKAR